MTTKKVLNVEEMEKAVDVKKATDTTVDTKAEKGTKKVTEKKTTKKVVKSSVTIQIDGRDVSTDDLVKRAQKEFKKLRKGVEIKTLDVYVNIYESKAYYVVNKESAPEFCLEI